MKLFIKENKLINTKQICIIKIFCIYLYIITKYLLNQMMSPSQRTFNSNFADYVNLKTTFKLQIKTLARQILGKLVTNRHILQVVFILIIFN